MKITYLLLLAGLWASHLPLRAQNQSQSQRQQPEPPATGGQVNPDPHALENDPGFKRLSPEAQEWVRTMSNRLDSAVARGDINALEQLQLDLLRHQSLGRHICGGHTVDEGTFLDAEAMNAPRTQQAVVARWLDPKPGSIIHSAIFTTDLRCIANDAITLDGKWIVRVLPSSLGVSKDGLVAYEAIYLNRDEKPTALEHRGVFIENRWLYDLNPAKASPPDSYTQDADRDFAWDDAYNRIVPKSGVVLLDVPQASKAQQPPCGRQNIPNKKSRFIPESVQQQIGKLSGQAAASQPCPAITQPAK